MKPLSHRIIQELRRYEDQPPFGVFLKPNQSCITEWEGRMVGPYNTPFEGAVFDLTINFNQEYPNRPPGVCFTSTIPFHPNVYPDGRICLDMLQKMWTPNYHVADILVALQSLLGDPNTSSPANVEAAQLYDGNRVEYEKRVRECVRQSP
eukprot:PhF_6_TR19492/c0_g1_i1/m.28472/K10573/UBE2A, UBC2, RAD6A; ubiquitin-conjugating enzyme E2 A